jgi:putative MATE family efflux protein
MTKNLTVGRPAFLILAFTAPLLIGNLFQQFYNVADTFIVGRTIGVEALAAVGCTGSMMFLILGFLISVTQGASIITSQRFGADDKTGVRRSAACGVILGALVTAFMMILSISTARPFLRFLGTPPEIFESAYSYIIIIFCGLPAAFLFNVLSNLMRSVGDSRTPLVFLVIACVINIILDYVFIMGFHTGVRGAAYATVIAQLTSGLLCLPVIMKKLPMLVARGDDWKVSRKELWEHARVALPMGFQMSIIAMGTLAVTFALNKLGTTSVAAFITGQKIDQVAGMPLGSFGVAMTTYAAQNYGARKYDRIKKGLIQCYAMSISFAFLVTVAFFIWGGNFAALFLGNDPVTVPMTHRYLKITSSGYFILSGLFIFRGSLQGLGNSLIPTIAGIGELVMRVFAAIILGRFFGFTGICFAGPLAFLGAFIPLAFAIVFTVKRLLRGK